jgi:uncharacterized protein YhaN
MREWLSKFHDLSHLKEEIACEEGEEQRDRHHVEVYTRKLLDQSSFCQKKNHSSLPLEGKIEVIREWCERQVEEKHRLSHQHKERSSLIAQHEELSQKKEGYAEEKRQCMAILDALKAQAGGVPEDKLVEVEQRSIHKKEQQKRKEQLLSELPPSAEGRQELLDAVAAADFTSFEDDRYEKEIQALDQRIGSLKEQQRQMDGSARYARRAAELEVLRAEIGNMTQRVIELEKEIYQIEKTIQEFCSHHQGPLIERASTYFQALTLGGFDRITPSFDAQDRPILTGIRSGGSEVPIPAMSEGTAMQLYLALRLASISLYLDQSPPFPLILDDLLIHFDEKRTAAALNLFKEIGNKNQVIIYSHFIY